MTLSRRNMFGLTGVGVAIAGTGGALGAVVSGGAESSGGAEQVPFHGPHQAGITTPAQDRMHFVAFDVTTSDRAELVRLLQDWTRAAERMTAGLEAVDRGATGGGQEEPPGDTGEGGQGRVRRAEDDVIGELVRLARMAADEQPVTPGRLLQARQRYPRPLVEPLAFGAGTHFCLGANLARLEVKLVFEELLRRMPDVRVADPGALDRNRSTLVLGIDRLPAVFTRVPSPVAS